ncbi:MAG: efflux RND transporter periplasmic adaptor subunit [Alphaproteobacteria bacterium]|nr:efflux RND transporter periplasmic adaptor subunit [Alphaproteobacteria bacterium]
MKKLLMLALLLVIPAFAHADDDTSPDSQTPPSYLVTASPVHKGDLPDQVTAYGTVMPMPDGATTLSLLRAGQVEKLSVSPGQAVKQGDALLDFASDPSVLASYDQAVSALTAAQKEQTRIQQLVAQHLATDAQLAQANKAVSDAQATLDSEKAQGNDKKEETLVAPFDGVVTSLNVTSGEHVQANAPLLQLAHRGGLDVTLGLPLDQSSGVHVGDAVHLTSLDMAKTTFDGRVATVSRMLDPQTRLVKVIVALPTDKLPDIVQGEQFRAVVERGVFSGIIVPRNAVLSDDKGAYIFQIANGKAVRVDVHIVGETGDEYALDGPIDSPKEIVTMGNYELKDGVAVRTSETKQQSTDNP